MLHIPALLNAALWTCVNSHVSVSSWVKRAWWQKPPHGPIMRIKWVDMYKVLRNNPTPDKQCGTICCYVGDYSLPADNLCSSPLPVWGAEPRSSLSFVFYKVSFTWLCLQGWLNKNQQWSLQSFFKSTLVPQQLIRYIWGKPESLFKLDSWVAETSVLRDCGFPAKSRSSSQEQLVCSLVYTILPS